MPKPVIVLAADHAGYQLKEQLQTWLQKLGHAVHDSGALDEQPGDDYPLYAAKVAKAVHNISQAKVILVCGSGAGIAMAANRFPWMRVVQATDLKVVKMSRADEDANGLALASRVLTWPQAQQLVRMFLGTKASSAARHRRRQEQLAKLP